MLKLRIITTIIFVPIVIASLFLLSPINLAIIDLIICILAAWEWGQIVGLKNNLHRILGAIFCGVVLVTILLSIYVFNLNMHIIISLLGIAVIWWIIAFFLVLFYPRSATWWKKSRILKIIFGAVTIVPFFSSIIVLRHYGYEINNHQGSWWLCYIIILVWSVDSGAYIFGRLFGKYKLSPQVSLEKTWEGLIGGLTTAFIVSLMFDLYALLPISSFTLLLCSIIVSLASILGDLTESMFKREAGLKDSSHLIPGHGGILDRIDSLTAAVPIFVCLIMLIFY
ncbi:Phosphatidate cytidylyltransferase [Candidatus Profftia lariciata]|uniref:phosphatidate cytidylyltransferase n=1 Tax=Candidatus Profftia lariciata TaxID=1987921 RepID=UPI001D032FEB|nr:phosphatidate cytidylyltransferase [Candidatus Profftia lariciata]UDG81551.1 Phosphatidate cytidylyltransferase [Candidatus Profftia lariciata]